MGKTLGIGNLIKRGGQLLLSRLGLWVLFILVTFVVTMASYILYAKAGLTVEAIDYAARQLAERAKQAQMEGAPAMDPIAFIDIQINWVWFGLAVVISIVTSAILGIGWTSVALKAAYGEHLDWKSFFHPMASIRMIGTFIVAGFLYGVMISFGFLFFVVPFFILLPKFALWPFLAVRHDLGPIHALRAASQVSMDAKPKILLLLIVLGVINLLLGFIPFIGALVAMAWAQFTEAETFKDLVSQTQLAPELQRKNPQ